ncbi:uncharacterized protein [Haliaeetus albicilla]|uniref:uncharacterized protein n=1 Tax=Haliaeetus albicilla TaxID=8969 RepID=UPI0037E72627
MTPFLLARPSRPTSPSRAPPPGAHRPPSPHTAAPTVRARLPPGPTGLSAGLPSAPAPAAAPRTLSRRIPPPRRRHHPPSRPGQAASPQAAAAPHPHPHPPSRPPRPRRRGSAGEPGAGQAAAARLRGARPPPPLPSVGGLGPGWAMAPAGGRRRRGLLRLQPRRRSGNRYARGPRRETGAAGLGLRLLRLILTAAAGGRRRRRRRRRSAAQAPTNCLWRYLEEHDTQED